MKIILRVLVLTFLYFWLEVAVCSAQNTVYISHAGAGSVNGTSCANAEPYSYFNSSANWSASPTGIQIGPGTTVHGCAETYNDSSANDTALTFQCSTATGSSSHPLALIFDQGVTNLFNTAYWNAAISNTGSCTYVVINGDNNLTIANQSGGIATNGTGLANSHQSGGVTLTNCTHCTIENMTVQNIYKNLGSSSGATDTNGANTTCLQINTNSTDSVMNGNTLLQCKTGASFSVDANGDASGITISGNNISDMDWGINVGGGDSGDTISNISIHDNQITNWTNWQFPTATFHQDGIILFNFASGSQILTASVYNNYIYGDLGVGSPTGFIYCAQNTSCAMFNNLLVNTGHTIDGIIWVDTHLSGSMIYNNTIVGLPSDIVITLGTSTGTGTSSPITVENNIFSGMNIGLHDYSTLTSDVGTSNHNVWRTGGGAGPQMATNDSTFLSYATWQGDGFDAASSTATPNLNGSYVPVATSSAIGLGANLTSLGITALDSDKAGNARPSSGAWDAGALNSGGGVSLTVSTTGTGSGTVSGTNFALGTHGFTSGTSIGPGTATPSAGSVFTGWASTGSASCSGTGTCPASGSFSLTATTTITATFAGTAATPTFSPAAGSYATAQRITISSTTPSPVIRYTVDGSTPTSSSAIYTHPLLISSTQTLKAITTAIGWVNSAVGSAAYTIAKTKTRFSLTPTSAASSPVPYPPDLRACCGSNVAAMNSALGTTDFTILHNWINAAIANNSTFTYTIQGFPSWMTGEATGVVTTEPPADLHTSSTCAATGTTTTDCSMKSFAIALFKDRTGLTAQPPSPVVCSHLDYLEIINEGNTDSQKVPPASSGASTGWTGTYPDLGVLGNDISTYAHLWCSNTVVVAGSMSAIVGFHTNGSDGHYDVAEEQLLAAWFAIPNASLPDAISVHLYPSRNNIIPMPMPTTIVSNSSATCTSGNTPNPSCYIATKDEVNQLNTTTTLQNPAIIAWAKSLPIYSTEGGFGEVAQLGATSTTTIGASFVAESMMAIAAQNPVNHMFYAADDPTWGCYWNCGSGSSAWLFAYNQMFAWLTAHSITGTLTSSAITGGNKWSLQLDSGAAELDFCDAWLTNCSTTTAFTTQTTLAGVTSGTGGSIILTQEPTLLTNTAVANAPTFSPVGGSYGPAQSVSLASTTPSATICFTTDGSLPTANGAGTCTHGTMYSTAISVTVSQTIKAVASKAGLTDSVVASSTYTINGAAGTPTFAPIAGTYTTAQAVAISTTTPGATLCFTLDGSTPTSSPAGTCLHGTTYASPVSVASNLTIKAIATESGFVDSSVASAAYVIAPVAGTPTFAPGTGTYGSSQSVTISTTTAGATLCYTVDGSTPTANGSGTCTHGTTYTTPVSVASSLTLKAVASKSGNTDSAIGSAVYTINGSVSTPTFLPAAGTYTSTQSVAISSTTPGAVLCYTTDGSTPTANGSGVCTHGTTYSSPVSVASSLTLKAVGSLSGFTDSTVGSAAYVIAPLVATPTFSPVAGSYGPSQSVTISTVTSGATLCYTTDGTTPTADGAGTCTHGTTYSTAVTVSSSLTLKAVGSKSGNTDSAVASGTYTINGTASTPTFSPVAGTYAAAQTVTISSTTSGATLCFTTDGTTPTADGAGSCTHGTTYSGPVLVASSLTLKAVASKAGFSDSTVGSAAYTILPPVTNVQVTGTGSIQGTGSVQ